MTARKKFSNCNLISSVYSKKQRSCSCLQGGGESSELAHDNYFCVGRCAFHKENICQLKIGGGGEDFTVSQIH